MSYHTHSWYDVEHAPITADVIIYKEGDKAVAKDSKGRIIEEGTDHLEVIQNAIALASRYTDLIVVFKGRFKITDTVVIPEPKIKLILCGGHLYAEQAIEYMFEYSYTNVNRQLIISNMSIVNTPHTRQSGFIHIIGPSTSSLTPQSIVVKNIMCINCHPLVTVENNVSGAIFENIRAYFSSASPAYDISKPLIKLCATVPEHKPRYNIFKHMIITTYSPSGYPAGRIISLEPGGSNIFESIDISCNNEVYETIYVDSNSWNNKFIALNMSDIANTTDSFLGESHIYIDGRENMFMGCQINGINNKIIKFGPNAVRNAFIGCKYAVSGTIESESSHPQIFIGNTPWDNTTITYDTTIKQNSIILDQTLDSLMGSIGVISDISNLPSSGSFVGQTYAVYDSGLGKWVLKVWDGSSWQTIGA